MARHFVLAVLLMCAGKINAASSPASWNDIAKKFEKKKIDASTIKPVINNTGLQHIEVADFRSDTSRVGMFSDFKYRPTELVFEGSETLSSLLEKKLANHSNPGAEVLMVIQDFWLSEIRAVKVENENLSKPEIHTSKAVCKVDIFIKDNNNYYPLTRIDTTLWNKRSITFSNAELLSLTLANISKKVETAINDGKYVNRKKASKNEIYTAYQQRFSYPAFINDCPKKGLYSSLEEFKNNKPYAENFAIKPHQKEPPSLYIVDNDGNETITRKVWGVCDGKNMYIMQQGMLFKLYKNANAFYWLGVKYFDDRMYETPPATPLGVGAEVGMEDPMPSFVKIRLTPYLLHPETGEGY
jgi:hypothetical protein